MEDTALEETPSNLLDEKNSPTLQEPQNEVQSTDELQPNATIDAEATLPAGESLFSVDKDIDRKPEDSEVTVVEEPPVSESTIETDTPVNSLQETTEKGEEIKGESGETSERTHDDGTVQEEQDASAQDAKSPTSKREKGKKRKEKKREKKKKKKEEIIQASPTIE